MGKGILMKKYNLIILAGGENEAWCQQYGYNRKALLPIGNKPMLEHVIDAYAKSPYIDNIVVVGHKELSCLSAVQNVKKHITEKNSFIKNLIAGVFYIKSSIYKFANKHNGYLISFCDAAYLTTDIVNSTLKNLSKHTPNLCLHYVAKETLLKSGFPTENRSYLPINEKPFTGANMYYVKNFRILFRALKDIVHLRSVRKEPRLILEHLGCLNKEFPEIEKILSKRLSSEVKIFVSPFAEMGVDVDKPIDYELAKDHFQALDHLDLLPNECKTVKDNTSENPQLSSLPEHE